MGNSGYSTHYIYTDLITSDIRLKKNIKNSKIKALEAVELMQVRQFDWKKGGHQNIGFVADELEEIDPNLALGGGYDENGDMDVKQINTPYLLNYAIKAIQELSVTVKEQSARLENWRKNWMELKGIDVSSNQGKPDWAKVAKSGVKFAILRVHQRDGIDSSFEYNYKGCKSNGILIGGYKYSYALTPAQAIDEAEDVIAALNGRGLDFPVFYDLEWSNQRKLGKQAVENIAVVFLIRMKKAGYKVGIYCNLDWYNNVLPDTLKKYDCWIARYPASDNGTVQTRLKPPVGVGWQYSSKGKVSGISGNVDMDVFYKDYRGTAQKGETKMVKISNCGHDENGRYTGGKAGDQTGTEYQIMNWYSRPWLYVLRFNDAKIAAMIADMATKAAQNNLIGYDQGTAGNSNDRYSFWQHLKASNYDPAQITVACESDCSASTAAIVKGAGYRLNNAKLKAVSIYLTTRNMRAAMKLPARKS